MSTLHVRIDGKKKKQAQAILEGLGMDLSQVVRIFVHQICITNGVPLQLLTENGYSVQVEEEISRDIQDALQGKGGKRHKDADAMIHAAYARTRRHRKAPIRT